MNLRDRHIGSLVGLASGDALGTTLEFTGHGMASPISDMVGGGPFRLAPGQWTDDTSMALCMASSLVECGFDTADQMRRYVRWRDKGYWSSTGVCFDIGNTTNEALNRFIITGDALAGSVSSFSAGNGSLMRLCPSVIYFSADAVEAVSAAAASSRTTHAAPAAVDACRYFAGLLVGAMRGEDKKVLLSPFYSPVPGLWDTSPLHEEVADVAAGSFRSEACPLESRAAGYVVNTLRLALWAFYHASDFRSGALAAVNIGGDADTTGAVYGQIAGAYFGVGGIPQHWRDLLARSAEIHALASRLSDIALAA
jgi:ADP-ribosyl-[dinitrogen reductase] hydrolase